MPKGDYLKDATLNATLRGAAFPTIASVDVALVRADNTEPSGGGYARKNVATGTGNWNAPASGGAGIRQVTSVNDIDFGTPTADWSTDANRVTKIRVYAGGTSNLLYEATKAPDGTAISKIFQSGDPVKIPAGSAAFQEIDPPA